MRVELSLSCFIFSLFLFYYLPFADNFHGSVLVSVGRCSASNRRVRLLICVSASSNLVLLSIDTALDLHGVHISDYATRLAGKVVRPVVRDALCWPGASSCSPFHLFYVLFGPGLFWLRWCPFSSSESPINHSKTGNSLSLSWTIMSRKDEAPD